MSGSMELYIMGVALRKARGEILCARFHRTIPLRFLFPENQAQKTGDEPRFDIQIAGTISSSCKFIIIVIK